jgi:ribosomal protein S18 acetylase RimI-like enzyme
MVASAIVSHNGRKGWINRLAVHPDFRRRNYACDIIEESENWLKKRGIEIFAVLIEADNDISQQLFTKKGYKRHDEIIYYTKKLKEDI